MYNGVISDALDPSVLERMLVYNGVISDVLDPSVLERMPCAERMAPRLAKLKVIMRTGPSSVVSRLTSSTISMTCWSVDVCEVRLVVGCGPM